MFINTTGEVGDVIFFSHLYEPFELKQTDFSLSTLCLRPIHEGRTEFSVDAHTLESDVG